MSAELHLKARTVKVLGPLSIVKDMFWAIKHQACPRLEFATADEIQQMVEESADERNKDRELAEKDAAAALAKGGEPDVVAKVVADQIGDVIAFYKQIPTTGLSAEFKVSRQGKVTCKVCGCSNQRGADNCAECGSTTFKSRWPGRLIVLAMAGAGMYLLRGPIDVAWQWVQAVGARLGLLERIWAALQGATDCV